MKIVISPDSFKGTLTAMEAAKAMQKGIERTGKSIETIVLPVADGGEGTAEILVNATNGHFVKTRVRDPLGRAIESSYGVLGDNKSCVIEMASASGIILLKKDELNPKIATTYGTGQLIKDAVSKGFRRIIICLGGSATNDAGVGMLRALGLKLMNGNDEEVQATVAGLYEVVRIDDSEWMSELNDCEFLIASDVNNPLVGKDGATTVFGAQKGVQAHEIPFFEGALVHWANIVEQQYGIRLHDLVGAGAAGGTGSAILGFLNGQFHQGIDLVLAAMNYSSFLNNSSYIITGEGQSDKQTLRGKAAMGVLKQGELFNIPVILLSGNIEEQDLMILQNHFRKVATIVNDEISQEMAITHAAKYLERASYQLFEQLI